MPGPNEWVKKFFTIDRYVTTPLTNTEVDSILADAEGILRTNTPPNDVSCGVDFKKLRAVEDDDLGYGVVDSQADFDGYCGRSAWYVHVVNQINWCGGIARNGYFLGCSQTPGPCMVVVRFPARGEEEGIVWAHEYGHTKGLQHRNEPAAVMNQFNNLANVKVNAAECAAIRQ